MYTAARTASKQIIKFNSDCGGAKGNAETGIVLSASIISLF